jgi:hypothetical protein
MSASTQEQTPPSEKSLLAESKADKKKIKVLKQALKEEREMRGNVE